MISKSWLKKVKLNSRLQMAPHLDLLSSLIGSVTRQRIWLSNSIMNKRAFTTSLEIGLRITSKTMLAKRRVLNWTSRKSTLLIGNLLPLSMSSTVLINLTKALSTQWRACNQFIMIWLILASQQLVANQAICTNQMVRLHCTRSAQSVDSFMLHQVLSLTWSENSEQLSKKTPGCLGGAVVRK